MGEYPRQLELFGAIHYDRLGKVTRELDALVEDADAVCIEVPERISPETYVAAVLKAPLCMLGAFVLDLLLYLALALVFNRDFTATEEAALRRLTDEKPVYRVDTHVVELLATGSLALVVVNWLIFASLFVYTPLASALVTVALLTFWGVPVVLNRLGIRWLALGIAVLAIGGWYGLIALGVAWTPLVLVAVFAYFAVVYRTVGRRNDHMIDRTLERAREDEHDDVLLITGKGHLNGMVDIARRRGVDVGRVHVSRWLRSGNTYEQFRRGFHEQSRDTTHEQLSDEVSEHSDGAPEAIGADGHPLESAHVAGGDATDISSWQGDRPARLGQRFGVWAVDVLALVFLVGAYLAVGAGLAAWFGTPTNAGTVWLFYLGIPLVVLGGRALLEGLGTGTPGQRLQNLQVVDVSGEPIGLRTALVRNTVWMADALLLYLPAVVDVNNRLLCDYVAGTDVVAGPPQT